MDPRARADTWTLVRELRARGTTVLLTTHYMDEAEQLCDRVAILDHGTVVATGTPVEVTSTVTDPSLRFATARPIDVAVLARVLERSVEPAGAEYVVAGAPSPELVATLGSWLCDEGVQLTELRTGQASLEEVFLRLTQEPPVDATASPARAGRRGSR